MCAGLQFIVNQEAAIKRTARGQQPQAWCGCCVYTDHNLPQKFLSQTKWNYLRMTLEWFANYAKQKLKAPCKTVLEKFFFLVHCTIMYSFLIAYIKVIHLSV